MSKHARAFENPSKESRPRKRLLVRIIRGKAAIELQPFRNEGKAACPLKMQAGELPMRSAAKRSNIVPSAELIGNIRAGAFVPPGLQLDQQSVVSFPRSMNNPG